MNLERVLPHFPPGKEVPPRKHLHMCVLSRFSSVQLFATPWTVACQAPLSMGFPRQEYWSAHSLLLCLLGLQQFKTALSSLGIENDFKSILEIGYLATFLIVRKFIKSIFYI